ncbi:hypothetical protein SAMN05444722_3197 [Rhodovulum sp. ES.010]|uniref:AbrB family transcriptional regulator n=1 Tax=Rhodovulum sp. ES.010 TaxID=1882821 RepID=UPI00092BB378|nr:AbrB family transcriptional regulator [Rhodovulum sp. ES.010]SIO53311.1 hypothetical protein SAMN05444722_3197 [Rhodovulum sp. ES.010]
MVPAIFTLAAGAAGALLATRLGVPAPFLTGPALTVTLLALAGGRVGLPPWLRDACFVTIGVNMGAGVTPEAMATATRWPVSLLLLAAALAAILGLGARLLRRRFGFDPMSALLAATPGHLSFVLSLSTDVRADLPRVTLIQTLRVLALTLLVPFLAPLLVEGTLPTTPPGPDPMALAALGPLVAGAVLLGLGFRKLGIPAALLLGGMAVSASGHASGLVEGAVPAWLSTPAFVTMGMLIGTRFSGVTPRMVVSALRASGLLTGFAVIVSLGAAALVSRLLDIPMLTALIAFAPGGLETMMAMSLLLNADPAYVAAHHVFRLLLLTLALPILVARMRKLQDRR